MDAKTETIPVMSRWTVNIAQHGTGVYLWWNPESKVFEVINFQDIQDKEYFNERHNRV